VRIYLASDHSGVTVACVSSRTFGEFRAGFTAGSGPSGEGGGAVGNVGGAVAGGGAAAPGDESLQQLFELLDVDE
jgi:hypothetical protein